MRFIVSLLALLGYVGAIVAANVLTANYGFVSVGFGLAATAGTFAAGLAFVMRDAVQDAVGRLGALAALAIGGVLSWWLATPALALASAAAFAISELVDMAVYTPLRRHGYIRAAMASNVAGSIVDTIAFLWIAGFGLSVLAVSGQLVGKIWITLAVVIGVSVIRALLRQRLARASA